jgi:hypothetical protein
MMVNMSRATIGVLTYSAASFVRYSAKPPNTTARLYARARASMVALRTGPCWSCQVTLSASLSNARTEGVVWPIPEMSVRDIHEMNALQILTSRVEANEIVVLCNHIRIQSHTRM